MTNEAPEHGDSLREQAIKDLSFIRETMARSAPLTAVSGKGMVGMGLVALVGGWLATLTKSYDAWLYTWLGVAVVGCLTGLGAMVAKGRRCHAPTFARTAWRFAFGLFPPILAGMVLTNAFYIRSTWELIPGTWLLLYGVGVVTAGVHSVRLVPAMGVCFAVLGAVVLSLPPSLGVRCVGFSADDIILTLGFGLVHIGFGAAIALRYDG
jgi:hypothetical protein